MATPTFKKGDRVRLRAWVQPRRASVLGRLFEHGWVGVVQNSTKYDEGIVVLVQHNHNPENPSAPFGQSFVYESYLELMPERQVHVVKDGKVYELRNNNPALRGTGLCKPCGLFHCNCSEAQNGRYSCLKPGTNYQEVTSGKLVS